MRLGECEGRQAITFYGGEGDAWYDRNKDSVMNPIVIRAVTSLTYTPNRIIEVGCGNGRYLNEMHKHYNCHCVGYDPSAAAIHNGKNKYPDLDLRLGTARAFHGLPCNILVFGFCLYLVDRFDIFNIVADADWCLSDGGYLIIHDFDPEHPHRVAYHHKDAIWSYKQDYPALWLANPTYQLISKTTTQEGEAITIIKKGGWPNA